VEDWLSLLAGGQAGDRSDAKARVTERTLALCVLRGALIDLLATGDSERTGAAVEAYLHARGASPR
jgi:hypothetical protein